jgi:hypothetical protein
MRRGFFGPPGGRALSSPVRQAIYTREFSVQADGVALHF